MRLWLEWLNSATDLARGIPAWWRGSELLLYRDVRSGCLHFGAAWLALRAVEGTRWMRTRGGLAAATGGRYALADDGRAHRSCGRSPASTGATPTPAQLELLRRLGSERHTLTFCRLPSFHRLCASEVPPLLRMEPRPSTAPGGAGPNDRPLYQVAAVPAGRYRLHPRRRGTSGLADGRHRPRSVFDDQWSAREPAAADRSRFPGRRPRDRCSRRRTGAPIVRALTIEPISVVPAASALAS